MSGHSLHWVRRNALAGCWLGMTLVVATPREAHAGCSDGACGRIDWTEVTDTDHGAPVAAKLHGAYAWEASPDGWATHPIAGAFSGYFWLTCRPDGGAADPTCKDALAREIAKERTSFDT